jgi:16S rRNA (cytosine1402-N4)-methyltransferase
MRMNTHQEISAKTILQEYTEDKLQDIFSQWGEVRNAKTLAQSIVQNRKHSKLTTTNDFIELISTCIRGERNTYLAQVFQSLRMEVNEEMDALSEMLDQAWEVLKPGGRLVVLTYHSVEDRVVKQKLKEAIEDINQQADIYGHKVFKWHMVTKKPLVPDENEIMQNPRSRSAKLRVAEKI